MEMRSLGLYLHIPFCVKKCRYCDFLSAPANPETRERYVQALCRQIGEAGRSLAADRERFLYLVDTVFLGGGTPSVLTAGQLCRILDAVRASFPLAGDAEITMECNPGTVNAETLQKLCAAGMNRLSIGLQSADNRQLSLLGRIHTREEFHNTYQAAREAGFSNINVDIISALPGQTVESLASTLSYVLSLSPEPEHISAYSLIVEEGTPFYETYRDGKGLPDEEETAAMDRLIWRVMEKAGYRRYEISNYARMGFACRHNLKYWSGEEYLGLGLGASSYLRRDCGLYPGGSLTEKDGKAVRYVRSRCTSQLAGFLSEAGTMQWEELQPVSVKEEMEEYVFLGLRKQEGISVSLFEARFGRSFAGVYGAVTDRYLELGLMRWEYDRIFLTEDGMEVSNRIMADYLLD